jgi:hypothetical protein
MSESQSLEPLAGWSAAFRGRFETRHLGHTWTVDADFLDLDQRLALYRDGGLSTVIGAVSWTVLAIERALRFKSNRWLD